MYRAGGGPAGRHGHTSLLYQTPQNSDYAGVFHTPFSLSRADIRARMCVRERIHTFKHTYTRWNACRCNAKCVCISFSLSLSFCLFLALLLSLSLFLPHSHSSFYHSMFLPILHARAGSLWKPYQYLTTMHFFPYIHTLEMQVRQS